jgi:acetolactate synthase-1/3 small subunit
LEKLVDVRDIKVLQPGNSVNHELMMVKVRADATNRQNLISIADIFLAKIADIGPESLIVEMTGGKNKLEAFLSMLDGYEILELARTGITGLSRGADDVRFLN